MPLLSIETITFPPVTLDSAGLATYQGLLATAEDSLATAQSALASAIARRDSCQQQVNILRQALAEQPPSE